jgi:hypothetical protein
MKPPTSGKPQRQDGVHKRESNESAEGRSAAAKKGWETRRKRGTA